MRRLRLVVLVSGRGTNLENLLTASHDGRMQGEVVRVICNRADAPAVDIARGHDVDTLVVPSTGLTRESHESDLIKVIDAVSPDLVLLAGYMRILSPMFIRHYAGRLINIHPSLLPAFPGLEAQSQAAGAGVRIAGCTTHFVTEDVDAGPILMQAAVTIPPNANAEVVASLILDAEHVIYPRTVNMLATGAARWDAGRVAFELLPSEPHILVSPEVHR